MTKFAIHELAADGYAIAEKHSVDSAYEANDEWKVIAGIMTWTDLRSKFDDLPAWMAEELIRVCGSPEDWPDEGEDFDNPIVIPEDLESELDLRIAASMLEDVPDDILDQFDAEKRTTLDGDLGFIWAEDLERFIEALEAAGHTVEWERGE